MKGLSANLSMLFTELPFLLRFEAAATAGFKAVEFWFPYEYPPEDVRHALRSANLECVVLNTPPGNAPIGEWGLSIDPDRRTQFKQTLDLALHYAGILGSKNVHVMAGIMPTSEDTEERAKVSARCRQTYLENLAYACEQAKEMPLKLLIEPLNRVDRPGYFLSTLEQSIKVIDSVSTQKLAVMWDVYHAQVEQGNLAVKVRSNARYFGHVQIADVPGRHEPGTGEINWPFLMNELRRANYPGWIGLEYKPSTSTQESFSFQHLLDAIRAPP